MVVAQKIGAKHYPECSAKTGEGVREVFQYATRAALLSKGKKKSEEQERVFGALIGLSVRLG
jgi:Ras family protein A